MPQLLTAALSPTFSPISLHGKIRSYEVEVGGLMIAFKSPLNIVALSYSVSRDELIQFIGHNNGEFGLGTGAPPADRALAPKNNL